MPGGLSRVAWAASPGLLGGSLGGVSGPKSAGRSLPNPLGFRIKFYVDFDVGFGSLWARSWVPLGGHFRSFWRLGRPKWVPEPSSNSLVFEKVIVHETICFIRVWGVSGPKMVPPNDPRSLQDGSKIVLDCFLIVSNFRLDF